MTTKIDFLTPGTTQIRHQIKNIVESYNHDWDLIAELAQNSVDAITMQSPVRGHIKLTIIASEKKIVIEDNGCGISPDELPELLTPFSSGKYGADKLIGKKGVGISFAIFSSAYFEVESHHSDGACCASIEGAWAWLDAETEELPKLDFQKIELHQDPGTRIVVKLPQDSENKFFEYSFDQLAMVLLTRTAIGDVKTIWGQKSDKSISLNFINLSGEIRREEFECSYFLPTSKLLPSSYISLRDFQEWNNGDRLDKEKRQKLRDKLIFHDGQQVLGGRTIRYWACFVPQRKVWDIVSVNSNLISREILDLNPAERIEKFGNAEYLFSGGMYTSTRGMPTGIRSELVAKGWAGYLPNFFIIVDDPQLSFDIGRKSIPGRQLGMLRGLADDVFRDIVNVIKKYVGGEPDVDSNGWDRTAVFNEIRELSNLESSNTKFLKRPSGQEATVAAIFYEMLGSGLISNIKPYISGYKSKYDLYAVFNKSDVVIEFKYTLASLFRDFDDEIKLFDEINIVVVWEVTENDYSVIKSRGLTLREFEKNLLSKNEPLFHFFIDLGPTRPINVICLNKLLNSNHP